MKISIITVTYNSEDTIRDTLKSVISQNYSDIEYLVIDGGSNDKTTDIIKEYISDIDYFISEKDNGMYDALNKGILAAQGSYIGQLHSDDIFVNDNVISNLVSKINNYHNVQGVYADLDIVKKDNTNVIKRKYSSANFRPWQLRFGHIFPHPTLYLHSSVFKKFGIYKVDYRVAADFEFILRLHIKGLKFKRVNINMIKMRDGGLSNNGIFWKIHQNFEIVRACKENNFYTNIFLVALKIPFKLIRKFI